MGSVKKRDDRGRPRPWLARYRGPDGREVSKAFRTKADADRWLRTEEGKLDRGEWVDPSAGEVLYGEWARAWLDSKAPNLKPKTLVGYESVLTTRVLPKFGTTEIRRITPEMVGLWLADMTGDGVSPARVRQGFQVLSASMKRAVKFGKVASNPCDRVADELPRIHTRRQLFLTAAQLTALAAEAETRLAGAGVLVTLLGYTGLRWGEAVALRPSAVDTDRQRVKVGEAATEVSGLLSFGKPKTHEVRTLILPAFLAAMLADHIDSRDPDGFVFTAPAGGPLRSSNFRGRVWLPAVESAAGVPDGLLVHDLRDTAASLAIASGASIKAVQRMLGHKSAAMTLDVYGSLFEEDLEDLADRMHDRYADAAAGDAAAVVNLDTRRRRSG